MSGESSFGELLPLLGRGCMYVGGPGIEAPGGPSRLHPGLLQPSTPSACPQTGLLWVWERAARLRLRTVDLSTCPMDRLPSQSVSPQVPANSGDQGTPSLLLQKPLLSCVPHCYTQEVSRVCHLRAGTYRIVPSTYLPDTEGAFTVTIATRIDRWGCGVLPPAHMSPLSAVLA